MIAVYANNTRRLTFAAKLARALGIRTLNSGMGLQGERREVALINWGSSTSPRPPPVGVGITWIGNTPQAVQAMSNKLRMFRAFSAAEVTCLEWTNSLNQADEWHMNGHTVYERHKLTGHSGAGIVVVRPDGNFSAAVAPLFTKGLGGQFREYRVHVVDGRVICVQLKKHMSAEKQREHGFIAPEGEAKREVRTWKNGWVFCVNGFDWPVKGQDISLQALRACGAETGAVDIAVRTNGDSYVVETNSAPALRSPTVLKAYVDAFNDLLRGEG